MNLIKLCILCAISWLIVSVTPGFIRMVCVVIGLVSGLIITFKVYFKFKELMSP
ncbi:MAG: hypothetical protein ACFFDT_28985 [Candidatus Hodarchaeota archaeon]